MTGFTLEPRKWYAMELIGPEFGPEVRRCSPIRVDAVELVESGSRRLHLSFFHAAYPEGVQSKSYTVETIQRSDQFFVWSGGWYQSAGVATGTFGYMAEPAF